MIGLYLPGTSALHRAPAGVKLLALAAAVAGASMLTEVWQLGVALLAVLCLYRAARIPWPTAAAQLRPFLWVLAVVLGVQLLFSGWVHALLAAGGLIVGVGLASLLTLTTTVSSILDVCQRVLRPLQRFGVDPDRVGLLLALTVRCLPLAAEIVHSVTTAQKARGTQTSVFALAAPTVVRALRTADALGESLIARGFDD